MTDVTQSQVNTARHVMMQEYRVFASSSVQHAPMRIVGRIFEEANQAIAGVAGNLEAQHTIYSKAQTRLVALAGVSGRLLYDMYMVSQGNRGFHPAAYSKAFDAVMAASPILTDMADEWHDADAAAEARIQAERDADAEQRRLELPALLLQRIRAAGGDLLLGKDGQLMATAGAVLGHDNYGTAVYTERKADFVALLQAEATAREAEAARLAPTIIA